MADTLASEAPISMISFTEQWSGWRLGQHDGSLVLSDKLPITRSINIFASMTREVSIVSERLDSSSVNTTSLAPSNSAMQSMSRKPWQDSPGISNAVSADNGRKKAARKLEQFVRAHIVPVHLWMSEKANKIKTLGGVEVWWEERNGKKVILPGGIVVAKAIGRVSNGEIWTKEGVIDPDERRFLSLRTL